VHLAVPGYRYRESVIEAVAEYFAEGYVPTRIELIAERGFDAFLAALREMDDPGKVTPEYVRQSTFWLVEGDTYHGRLSLRHELNEALRQHGGNIGYDIRPSSRRRGLGTIQLALGLDKAREIGLERVLLTCDDDNFPSIRIIEVNGGVLEDVIDTLGEPGRRSRRYWIEL
jgi:predicted acetyltransferase